MRENIIRKTTSESGFPQQKATGLVDRAEGEAAE